MEACLPSHDALSMTLERLNHPSLSATYLLRGLKLLATPELRQFIWIPLLTNLVLYAAALLIGIHYFSVFVHDLLPAWLGFLSWVLWLAFAVAFILIMYFSFTLMANLIGAPFYGRLAEKIMAQLGGMAASPEQPWGKALTSGLAAEFGRLRYFLARAIPLLILFVIPGLNLVAPFLWLWFNAWFLAMEYLAYPLEEQGIGFDEQRRLASGMRTGVLSFGGAALLGLAVPGLNVLIPPAAVIGAALYVSESRSRVSL
jgi:CysZ protein